jgi:hypothetical protein
MYHLTANQGLYINILEQYTTLMSFALQWQDAVMPYVNVDWPSAQVNWEDIVGYIYGSKGY